MASFPPRHSPSEIIAEAFASLPKKFRRENGQSEHATNQKRGRQVHSFLEGPVVVRDKLYMTDIPYGRIFEYALSSGDWSLLMEYDGEPNGLAWHPQKKKLVIADFKNGIFALDIDTKELSTVITRFNGERFKGPNDLIVGADGSIYFTDQGMSGLQDPSGRVYRLHPDGRVDVLLKNCPSPNGLVLDKSETSLFVAMTRDNSVWHLPIYPDGTVQRTARFSTYYGVGGPDGLTIDEEGNLFVAHSTLGLIFVHKSNGEPLARLVSSRGNSTTNLTWDTRKMNDLLIVESETGSLMRVHWHCRGWLGKNMDLKLSKIKSSL